MDMMKCNRKAQNTRDNSRLTADVYFLIQRFLSNGPLKRTLQTLNEELDEHQILPKRVDWQGNQHEQSIEDMQRQYPYIHKDFLYYLCSQASTHLNPNHAPVSFLSFRPKEKDKDGILSNYKQYFNYVTRLHGAPITDIKSSCNIVNSIRGREVGGVLSRTRTITPRIYNGMQMQRITIGHLSSVYCLLFDHSGRYVITGADDLLIKLWSTHTGRLIATFRGASSEITDIAVDPENFLLAAGSIDKNLRVWNLHSGVPVAVLTGHTGHITSVNFCPTPCWGHKYLISTSSDGSIAFWTYSSDGPDSKVEFRNTPNLYQEKLRPGQAQMICSSFSPGGTFLATGSADHHVRVYYMKADEGPQRILETEAHIDRVDSIQWAHSGLKFLSGSKDGNAIIWWFERQQWKNVHLAMTTKLPNEQQNTEPDTKNKIKVTMVAWNRSDSLVITAVSDHSLKVWTSNGQLVRCLKGHTDEAYVLEPHPHDEDVILSAGHDGQILIWDIHKGEILFQYVNNIEGQGYGSIFDAKWSPDGCNISASDSHGDILTFGFGAGSPFYKQLPKELFFHTDYRPLVRDQQFWVLDEQTQVPPHLMPPPFLVDIDGNPYPPMLQRLVPGRENCNVDQLVPNMVIGNEGNQEVIQDVPDRNMDESEDEDGRGFAGGSLRSQRIRQSTGDWQTDHNIEWKKSVLMEPISYSVLHRAMETRKLIEHAEMNEYQKQLKRRPLMISTTAGPSHSKDKKKRAAREPKKSSLGLDLERYEVMHLNNYQTDTDESSFSDWAEEVSEAKKRRSNRRKPRTSSLRSSSDNDDDDDDDTDLTEDTVPTDSDDSHHERSERRSRNHRAARQKTRKSSPRASVPKNPLISKKDPSPKTAQTAKHTAAEPSTSGEASTSKGPKIKVSEQYKLSEWLSETRPRKSPYYPQIHDEIVYFIQGHLLYVEAVKLKNVYEPNIKELPWVKGMQLKDHEFCKVVGIRYEIQPPRLCCLKLALQDNYGRPTGKTFTIRFHDMPDVLDFFVLKQSYLTAMSRDWQNGERFRCMIDDNWWIGEIAGKSPASDVYPDSAFMCYEICWTNGEQERMSPWDMEPVDESRLPEDEKEAVPVLEHELRSILYKAVADDWPNCQLDTACQAIARGLTQVMELAIAEPFLVPVDINAYPTYALIVEYPIDLSTIKARFENNFYRRMSAAQFDISYLETNAAKFNEQRSVIVKHAKILAALCLKIVKSGNDSIDIAAVYHQLVAGYDSSDSEEEIDVEEDISKPSTSRAVRYLPVRSWKSPDDWRIEASGLVELMMQSEDSVPFRFPVNMHKYPTYQRIIETPMDLGTVKDNLQKGSYRQPIDFCTDIRLIFQNSRTFNTNKRSRIYLMTVHLSNLFEEQMKKIMKNWRITKKRQRRHLATSSSDDDSCSSSSSDAKEVPTRTPPKPEEPKVIVERIENGLYNVMIDKSDSDSDNTPLYVIKAMNTSSSTENGKIVEPLHQRLDGEEENFEPEPSTSSQSQIDIEIEDFDHDYANKTSEKLPDEDTDTDQPSSSSRSKRSLKNNNLIEKSSDEETYRLPAPRKFEPQNQSSSDNDNIEVEGTNQIETNSTDEDDSDENDTLSSIQARQLQQVRKKQTSSDDENDEDFCPEDSSGSSKSKPVRRRKKASSSEEEFEVTSRKSRRGLVARKRKSSFVVEEEEDEEGSSNSSSPESSDDDLPLRNARLRRNPKKNKNYQSTESDSDAGRSSRKRRKLISGSQLDSDSDDTSKNGRPGYFGSVSSRGRLRKITERAAAFLKKDKKVG